jgi:hypothetical protein
VSGEQIITTERLALVAGCSHLTPGDVRSWVAGAQPGAVMAYALGFNAELHAAPHVAEEMRGCEALGYVLLKQKRVEPFKLLYLAERSSRPLTDPKKDTPGQRRYVQAAA